MPSNLVENITENNGDAGADKISGLALKLHQWDMSHYQFKIRVGIIQSQ